MQPLIKQYVFEGRYFICTVFSPVYFLTACVVTLIAKQLHTTNKLLGQSCDGAEDSIEIDPHSVAIDRSTVYSDMLDVVLSD